MDGGSPVDAVHRPRQRNLPHRGDCNSFADVQYFPREFRVVEHRGFRAALGSQRGSEPHRDNRFCAALATAYQQAVESLTDISVYVLGIWAAQVNSKYSMARAIGPWVACDSAAHRQTATERTDLVFAERDNLMFFCAGMAMARSSSLESAAFPRGSSGARR